MSSSARSEAIEVYNAFASVYATGLGQEGPRTLPVYEELVLRDIPAGAHILDVCCGTGQLARELTKRGFRITGIDASERMLQYARRNAPAAQFICIDVRRFVSRKLFSAALSTFNSFAHLRSTTDLEQAFLAVRGALGPGTKFCFDLYMEAAYLHRWHGEFEVAAEGQRCRVLPSYDPGSRMASNRIRFLDIRSDKVIHEMTMTQHCFTRSAVVDALSAVGFTRVQTFDAAHHFGLKGEEDRLFFLARTPE